MIFCFLLLFQELEVLDVAQSHTRTLSHSVQWIFCHVERNTDFVLQALVKTAEQCATTSQVHTVANNVGIQLDRKSVV